MTKPIVVLDACVLIPMPLCDTLLRAAEQDLYRFHTSQKILEETERNLAKIFQKRGLNLSLAQQKAHKKIQAIQKAFPEALIEVSDTLIQTLKNDPKDRHVLATAIEARKIQEDSGFDNLILIVTHNLKDFHPQALLPYNVQAIDPDQFLLKLVKIYDSSVLFTLLSSQAENNKYTLLELLEKLEKGKIINFVRLIIDNYYLDDFLKDLTRILCQTGSDNNPEEKYLKWETYQIYLKNDRIEINSSKGETLLLAQKSSEHFLITKNTISCNDFISLSSLREDI